MIKPDFFYWFPYEEVITIVQILAAGNVDKLQCDTMVSILFLYSSNMDGQRHQMVENAWTAFLLEYKF